MRLHRGITMTRSPLRAARVFSLLLESSSWPSFPYPSPLVSGAERSHRSGDRIILRLTSRDSSPQMPHYKENYVAACFTEPVAASMAAAKSSYSNAAIPMAVDEERGVPLTPLRTPPCNRSARVPRTSHPPAPAQRFRRESQLAQPAPSKAPRPGVADSRRAGRASPRTFPWPPANSAVSPPLRPQDASRQGKIPEYKAQPRAKVLLDALNDGIRVAAVGALIIPRTPPASPERFSHPARGPVARLQPSVWP